MAAHRWDCSKAQFVELGFSKVCMASSLNGRILMVLVLEEGSSQQLADAHCRVARYVVSKSNPHNASYDLRHDERGYNWRVETLLTDMNVLFSYVAQVNFFWLPIPEILWRTMNPVYVSITPGDVCATQALLRMSTGNKAEYEELSWSLFRHKLCKLFRSFTFSVWVSIPIPCEDFSKLEPANSVWWQSRDQ